MERQKFTSGDTAVMKKSHPCSSNRFLILRAGSDVRIKCVGCGHEITLDRIKFEKMIKTIEVCTDEEKKGTTV